MFSDLTCLASLQENVLLLFAIIGMFSVQITEALVLSHLDFSSSAGPITETEEDAE